MEQEKLLLSGFYKSLTILCVEDEPEILEVYKGLFSPLFSRVLTASNGDEGLRIFQEEAVDIILTDQVMPICTGLDMSKSIRKLDSSIPIILVTALDSTSVLKQALDLHVTSFLNKPFTKDSLLSVFNVAVKSVIADKLVQKEQNFTIKKLTKSVNYNAYQEKLSFEKEKVIAQNDLDDGNMGSYKCSVHYEPLDILSGDSYVIRNINDNETFMFLVDGMGKGISASLSAMLSSASINYYIDNEQSKNDKFDFDKFLEYVFSFIQPTLLEYEVISAHFLLYDKSIEELKYAIFSMPPILLLSKENSMNKIKSNNPPFSKYGRNFNIDVFSLKDIKKALIHSDGLNENSIDEDEKTYGNYLEEDFFKSTDKESFQEMVNKRIIKHEDDITYIYLYNT